MAGEEDLWCPASALEPDDTRESLERCLRTES